MNGSEKGGIYGPARCARAFFNGAKERDAYIYPACCCEEGHSALAIMEYALLLLIRSSAFQGPALSGSEEAGLTGCAIVGGSSISSGKFSNLLCSGLCSAFVLLFMSHQRPDDACVLVSNRCTSFRRSESLLLIDDLQAPLVDLAFGSIDDRPRSMNQEGPEVGIVSLTDS